MMLIILFQNHSQLGFFFISNNLGLGGLPITDGKLVISLGALIEPPKKLAS